MDYSMGLVILFGALIYFIIGINLIRINTKK